MADNTSTNAVTSASSARPSIDWPAHAVRLSITGTWVMRYDGRVQRHPRRIFRRWTDCEYHGLCELSEFKGMLSPLLAEYMVRGMLKAETADLAVAMRNLDLQFILGNGWYDYGVISGLLRPYGDEFHYSRDDIITWLQDQIPEKSGDEKAPRLQELEQAIADHFSPEDKNLSSYAQFQVWAAESSQLEARFPGMIDFALPEVEWDFRSLTRRGEVWVRGERVDHYHKLQLQGGSTWDGSWYDPDERAVPQGFSARDPLRVRCEMEVEPGNWQPVSTRAVKLSLLEYFDPEDDSEDPEAMNRLRAATLAQTDTDSDEVPGLDFD